MVEYLSGNRIQGSSTLTASPPSTSWKELGRTTLSSAADDITVSSFTAKDNLMILCSTISTGNIDGALRFNTDTGTNYSIRRSENGASDVTSNTTNQTKLILNRGHVAYPNTTFSVSNMINISAQEKLVVGHSVACVNGASNAPDMTETTGKWANTSAQVTSVTCNNSDSGSWDTGSEVVILGYDNDEADSGTNYWQELASVDTSSTHDVIDTGTFTNKKYLWLQCFVKGDGNANSSIMFNTDTSSSGYAMRRSYDGGNVSTYAGTNPAGSEGSYDGYGATGAGGKFFNMFIVNDGSNEASWVCNINAGHLTGAGNAPHIVEWVGKWDLTDAITRIRIKNQDGGTSYSESTIKVWGSD